MLRYNHAISIIWPTKEKYTYQVRRVHYEAIKVRDFYSLPEVTKDKSAYRSGGEYEVLAIENRKPWFCFETLNQLNRIKIGMAGSHCRNG